MTFLQSIARSLGIKPILEDIPPGLVNIPLKAAMGLAVRGKWVSVQGRVGIISELSSADSITVDYVDPVTGYTTESARVSIGLCSVAKWDQIPECRRGISQEAGQAKGYF
jgi:hypothetical protein